MKFKTFYTDNHWDWPFEFSTDYKLGRCTFTSGEFHVCFCNSSLNNLIYITSDTKFKPLILPGCVVKCHYLEI